MVFLQISYSTTEVRHLKPSNLSSVVLHQATTSRHSWSNRSTGEPLTTQVTRHQLRELVRSRLVTQTTQASSLSSSIVLVSMRDSSSQLRTQTRASSPSRWMKRSSIRVSMGHPATKIARAPTTSGSSRSQALMSYSMSLRP